MFQNQLIFNIWGGTFNLGAIMLNISEMFSSTHINKTLTLIISCLAIIWWCMKIYDQYITTRAKKAGVKVESKKSKS
ncbi:hypothetical protein [Carboxylicivirga marina]|uniref:hypothetical protein n=1 Tax=Carboxylicivirga marina TaxID=2800988 RepID=UPI002594D6EE|nr:hypothetical protein [uncultured Carboxylicivirga sp.]